MKLGRAFHGRRGVEFDKPVEETMLHEYAQTAAASSGYTIVPSRDDDGFILQAKPYRRTGPRGSEYNQLWVRSASLYPRLGQDHLAYGLDVIPRRPVAAYDRRICYPLMHTANLTPFLEELGRIIDGAGLEQVNRRL